MDNANPIAAIVPLVAILLFIGLWLYSIAWAAADARRRGKSAFLVGLLVFLLHPRPLGLVAWLVFRPELRPTY